MIGLLPLDLVRRYLAWAGQAPCPAASAVPGRTAAATLTYDHASGRFLGSRYAISVHAFACALGRLLAAGWDVGPALDYLLDEAVWPPTLAGVKLLPRLSAEEALREAEQILHAQRHACHG